MIYITEDKKRVFIKTHDDEYIELISDSEMFVERRLLEIAKDMEVHKPEKLL